MINAARKRAFALSRRPLVSAMSAGIALFSAMSAQAQTNDPVVFSFATVGDTRQDPSKPDPTTKLAVNPSTGAGAPSTTGSLLPQDAMWLQNSKAWSRILRTVQSEKANMLFVNGDMIMGYGRAAVPSAWTTTPPASPSAVVNSDLVKFYTQYAYWRGMVANSFETGTYVMPVPGNHETQCNSSVSTNTGASACASGKFAYVENENAWRVTMGDLIGDLSTNLRFSGVTGAKAQNVTGLTSSTAPTAATDSRISTDQSDLSYSFDISTSAGILHFAVINTDATGYDSHAPTGWLSTDFANAKARGANKFFVFGHKAAFTYNYAAATGGSVAAGGLDVDATARNAFWQVILQYKATYFSGHEHVPHIQQYADPTNTVTGSAWQVLVGSGGSPFDDAMVGCPSACAEPTLTNPTDRTYAWALVQVHASGAVSLNAYGFSDTFGPTQMFQSIPTLQ